MQRVLSFSLRYLVLALFVLPCVRPAIGQDSLPTVTIYATDWHASEGGLDTGTFTVTRTGQTNFPLAVYYQISGNASNGVDYEQLDSFVQIPAGAVDAALTVNPIEDSLFEGNEMVVIQLTSSPLDCATCGYNIGAPSNAVVVILDNDGPSATNHPPSVEIIAPGNGAVLPAPANIRISASPFDADGFFGTVEFFEGAHSLGIITNIPIVLYPTNPFSITWSNVPTGSYELTAKATDDKGAIGVSARVHVFVVETNVQQPVVNIYAIDETGSEGPVPLSGPAIEPWSDPALFTVTRSGPTDLPLTLFYSVGGTATIGTIGDLFQADYFLYVPAASAQPPSGSVTIPAGASSENIEVVVVDDSHAEGIETVELTLQLPPMSPPPPNCYLVGASGSALAYILDDDRVGTNLVPEVHLATPRDGATFVGPTNILLGASAFDADGSVAQVEFFEGHRTLGLATGPLRTPFGAWLLAWSNVVPGQYTLSAHATDNLGAVSVSAPVKIRVVAELPPPPETNLPPVVNIVARDPFASEGTNFWLADWDANRWAIEIWNPWQVNLGGTNTATFVVRRYGPTNDALSVNYDIGGTASNGVDYAALPGSITFPAGRRSARIVLAPIDDAVTEGIETVVLTLQPSPDYIVGFPAHAAAIIVDNNLPRPRCVLLPDRQFHFCGPATNGFCFRVEVSPDLLHWLPLCTNVVTDGALHFVDPDAPSLQVRFYRAMPELGLLPDD